MSWPGQPATQSAIATMRCISLGTGFSISLPSTTSVSASATVAMRWRTGDGSLVWDEDGVERCDLVGSKNSNLLNDPDFTTKMLAVQRAARKVAPAELQGQVKGGDASTLIPRAAGAYVTILSATTSRRRSIGKHGRQRVQPRRQHNWDPAQRLFQSTQVLPPCPHDLSGQVDLSPVGHEPAGPHP